MQANMNDARIDGPDSGALSSDTKMIQAGILVVSRVDQRFRNSDWTGRAESYGAAGRTRWRGRRPIWF